MDRILFEDQREIKDADLADLALMKRLAGRHRPEGAARLGLRKGEVRRLERLLEEAHGLRRSLPDGDEALARLDARGPMLISLARQAAGEGGARLPAWGGEPRVEAALAALCRRELPLTRRRMLDALSELDALQPLTQRELWAVPEALRTALIRGLLGLSGAVLARARLRERAVRWARSPKKWRLEDAPAFLAEALKCAGEEDLPRARRLLDGRIARLGLSPEAVVARAQAEAAGDLLRLDHLLATARLLEALDWKRCFEALSRVERELAEDPSGVYPRMDDASRQAVREQVAYLARRLKLPEQAVARCAVDAARDGEGVCWWLYDDAGRRSLAARLGRGKVRLRKLVPDPTGRWTVCALLLLGGLLAALLCACAGTPWLWPDCGLLGWTAADALAGRVAPRLFPPARLLKLDMETIPEDCRTLVTVPALLSSPERAKAACDQLEALGCLEQNENIEYLLLADLPDAPERELPGDEATLESARAHIAAMNARAGREKYALLCRERTLLAADGLWMGRDRKRGALMDLNRLLLGRAGSEAAFSAEGAACGRLKRGRFAFVVTLDADTRALPGDIRALIGTLAHPLNRPEGDGGLAVLQPRMETPPSARVNGFAALLAGRGGLSAYPVDASNLWQDATGRGIYGGKGIYHVAAFQRRVEGALPEGRVLSHDLAEGALAGAGFVGDIPFLDGHPATLSAALARRHRWTRGDWQLLPLLLSRRPLPGGRRLGAADRFRMADNLARSLRDPALLALLMGAVWRGDAALLLAAMALVWLEPLLDLPRVDALRWRRGAAELSVLPLTACNALDAVLRTLWRLGVSGKHLLEWVTAADAEQAAKPGGGRRLPGRVAALLLLPGLLTPLGRLPALALAALFLAGPGWIGALEARAVDGREALSDEDRALFMDLACRTWRFFGDNMPPDGSPLPPDNVQLDPPVGAARRTSPTNIALYLLSCLAARRLGFIGMPELHRRWSATLSALEAMEKWQGDDPEGIVGFAPGRNCRRWQSQIDQRCTAGQLYNWYDIDTLAPLRPRYVSSVDSGNLAAALLLCAGAAEAGELAPRLRALAEGMDLAALYDPGRELFYIGLDGESGRPSASHYDLLASESRLLSYTAMMLGEVPPRHWARLGRPCAWVGKGVAPLSWSGTLFEYLMPLIFLAAPPRSLLGEGVRAATRAQMDEGRRLGRPWGVSESGHSALDAQLNYQYRAFGLPALALDGEACQGVVAPYAAALAAMLCPKEAAANLRHMVDMGWAGPWGLAEAADYRGSDAPRLVRSHMAHHQGMALCALCNALTGDSLRHDFMALPQARALAPLLEEPSRARIKPHDRDKRPYNAKRPVTGSLIFARVCPARGRKMPRKHTAAPERRWPARRPAKDAAETHLLSGGGSAALCTGDGDVHYRRGETLATRFPGALGEGRGAARVYLTDLAGGQVALGAGASFEPGLARYAASLNSLEARLTACLSPEDGTLLGVVEVKNAGSVPARCAVTGVAPVALCPEADWQAHAVFQALFVESERPERDLLVFRRRPGSRGGSGMKLACLAAGPGEVSCETDFEKLAGRMADAGGTVFDHSLSGTVGATLNPAAALRVALELAPGQSERVCLAMRLLDGGDSPAAWAARWRAPEEPTRAMRLASVQAASMLDFIGLDDRRHGLLQRMAALLADGGLAARARSPRRGETGVSREALWSLGVSGDRPILALYARRAEDSEAVRELIRAHAFYRALCVETDLVLVDDGDTGYARPVGDMLEERIAASHLNRLRAVPGGVWRVDGSLLEGETRRELLRFASATFEADRDLYSQVRELLAGAENPQKTDLRPMDVGRSRLAPVERLANNGYGGFLPDGAYELDVLPDRLTPAPWCHILANGHLGALLSERGGGFFWHGNSREGRLTPWGNDGLWEGWGLSLMLAGPAGALPLLPGERPRAPWRVRFHPREAVYALDCEKLAARARYALPGDREEIALEVTLENRGLRERGLRLVARPDWLMGADPRDRVALDRWAEGGACLATGAMEGVGWLAAADPLAGAGDPWEGALTVPLDLPRGRPRTVRLALGWAADVASARKRVAAWRAETPPEGPPERRDLVIETPDKALNALANGFLLHQVRASRVLGRTGLYQPGGAWGFRDQLQDMLALLHGEPERVRAHLLRCAARQFEAGDVLHWWHEPCRGVRTRVSDDLLFLPWVATAYVEATGDAGALEEAVPYLMDAELPEGRADVYRAMAPGATSGTLHDHCMRAFRRADRRGRHGLLLMGGGDWNDGMDRVGARGRGESVWLSQFAIACADRYRRVAPKEEDRAWLWRFGEELRRAVEDHGWDGGWYLRAYDDDGCPLGSANDRECRIDAISQAWAVLAGLDANRCRVAMDAAWDRLVDRSAGIIRLLTPPFDGHGPDPGYIRGYPPGVRENGGQYTHGALWIFLALIRMGDAKRAHRALDMLLPFRHSDAPDKARVYRVEPYVMAADIYDRPGMAGRGGWTWYTGSAAWMYNCILALLGYERRENRVRLNALLGDWPAASVTVPFGQSTYRLVCDRTTTGSSSRWWMTGESMRRFSQ